MIYKGGAANVCTNKLDCQCSECSKTTCTGKPDCPCYGCLYVRQNGKTPKVHVTPDSLFDAVVSNNENEIKNTLVETLKKKVIPSIKSLNKMISRGKIDEIKPLVTLNPKYDESTLNETINTRDMSIINLVVEYLKKRKFYLTKEPLFRAIKIHRYDILNKISKLELDSTLDLDYFLEIVLEIPLSRDETFNIENNQIVNIMFDLYITKKKWPIYLLIYILAIILFMYYFIY
jgi:hypothetical protein